MSRSEHRSRWTPTRKAALVDAVAAGDLTESEACTLHEISPEEFAGWRRDYSERGREGLNVRTQGNRDRNRAARFSGYPGAATT